MRIFCYKIVVGICLAFSVAGYTQITQAEKKKAIMDIAKVLEERYVFPEVAEKMNQGIIHHFDNGNYDTITDPHEFVFQLSQDLKNISQDLHLDVEYHENEISTNGPPTEEEEKERAQWLEELLNDNGHGVRQASILEGNVGYLEMPLFGPLEQSADTLIRAMKKIEDTDALIIDLRSCMGSLDENSIPFLSSYFFKEPVHLFDFYNRPMNTTKQFWSYAWLPHKRYLDKPIYILTSGKTFSGGEEFAYDLQQLKRAFLIGETTRGGANPKEPIAANSHYMVTVPYMRSVNPITKTNWEGVGVVPDSTVTSNKALYVAHVMALNSIWISVTDQAIKEKLEKQIEIVKLNRPEFRKVTFVLKGYEGANKVALGGTFNFWAQNLYMAKDGDQWTIETEVEPGTVPYKFFVDGKWITDPGNPETITENGDKRSVIEVQ